MPHYCDHYYVRTAKGIGYVSGSVCLSYGSFTPDDLIITFLLEKPLLRRERDDINQIKCC